MAHHTELGKLGETIASTFLMKHNFTVLQRNYRANHGEIDIIAKKDSILRFVEVKSVKVSSFDSIQKLHVKPEENITYDKWKNLVRTSQIYVQGNVPHKTRWQVDLACVYINESTREGRVVYMENIHKE